MNLNFSEITFQTEEYLNLNRICQYYYGEALPHEYELGYKKGQHNKVTAQPNSYLWSKQLLHLEVTRSQLVAPQFKTRYVAVFFSLSPIPFLFHSHIFFHPCYKSKFDLLKFNWLNVLDYFTEMGFLHSKILIRPKYSTHTHALTPRSLFTEWTRTLSWHNSP